MIAVNPDLIIVEDAGTDIISESGKPLGDFLPNDSGNWHIDQKWGMRIPEQGGTAYIRISPELRDFFKLCQEKHGVIGFEYDFDDPGLNFGLILKKESSK